MPKRRGFGWIARLMHEGDNAKLLQYWHDSQMMTRNRSNNPKRRDNKRIRAKIRGELRRDER